MPPAEIDASRRPRTILICHRGAVVSQIIARWMATFSDLVGIVEIEERGTRTRGRIRREIQRIGWLRFLDVVLFRIFYRLTQARRDRDWTESTRRRMFDELPSVDHVPVHRTHSPNTKATREFMQAAEPDFAIALCKMLLKPRTFRIPSGGVFVFHPGICPEYRNAHGCFWALANDQRDLVGMTLLRIDEGVDTGPVYGYFSYDFDERAESHIVIQNRVVLENLDALRDRLLEIHAGVAQPIDVRGRPSGVWGQPWLSKHLAIRARAPRRSGG